MRHARIVLALVAVPVLTPVVANGQTVVTLSEVLTRARERAPEVVSARLAIEEARGRLAGASLRVAMNPEIGTEVGGRSSAGERTTDFELGVFQPLEPSGRRSARLAAAHAGIDRSTASLEETTRLALRTAAATYYRALHARDRLALLATAEETANRMYQAANRRFQAGDVAVLDVNIARAALARVRSDRQATTAAASAALGDLKVLLGLEGEIRVEGSFDEAAPPANLMETALLRPEIKELEASLRQAEAEVQLGKSFQKPEYGFGAAYAHDEGDQVISGSFRISLPVFAKGQELRATGSARALRIRAELESAKSRIRTEVTAAQQVHALRLEAVRLLETEALPGLDENAALASRSFEVGQIGLPEFLLIGREILDTRFQYLDSRLEATLARIDLLSSAGVLR